MSSVKTFVLLFDLHYPKHNKAAWRAALSFIKQNTIHGILLGGE